VFLVNSPTKAYKSRVLAHKYDMSSKMYSIYIYGCDDRIECCSSINYGLRVCRCVLPQHYYISINFQYEKELTRTSHGPDDEFHKHA